jgi:uncharacterized protein YcfJ
MKPILTSLLIILSFSSAAHNNHNQYSSKNHHQAKVTQVPPIYRYVSVQATQPLCHGPNIDNTRQHSTPTIIGGLVGASIGHIVSQRPYKGIGAIAGAVVGSTLALHVSNSSTLGHTSHYWAGQDCVGLPTKTGKKPLLTGYAVTNKYQGHLYQTTRQSKPNKTIRVYH